MNNQIYPLLNAIASRKIQVGESSYFFQDMEKEATLNEIISKISSIILKTSKAMMHSENHHNKNQPLLVKQIYVHLHTKLTVDDPVFIR